MNHSTTTRVEAGLIGWLMAAALAASAGCTVGVVGEPSGGGGGGDSPDDPPPSEPVVQSILAGAFAPLGSYTGVEGRAQLVRYLDGTTSVDVQLLGLAPGTEFVAHVHAQPCQYQGGGHYMIDPALTDSGEANELWLHLTSDDEGVALTQGSWDHMARGDALSIVVHDPAAANAKMACADLLVGNDTGATLTGPLAPFALAVAGDMTITGSATATRSEQATRVELDAVGLDPAAEYVAHVHALPCEVTDGGGHYKIDPTVVDTLETNEIWLTVTVDAGGQATAQADAPAVRADAQSVVLHRVDGADKPKVACANLVRTVFPGLARSGQSVLLADGMSRLPGLSASASMSRTLAGATVATLNARGLTPGTTYPAHVHDRPCAVDGGGGHYKMDALETGDPDPANEIWLSLEADASGQASDSTWVAEVARSEARSIVIHDPVDKARLACIDLE